MEQRIRTWSLILLLGVTPAAWASEAQDAADLHSDTWVATDALGRSLPGFGQCGPARRQRPKPEIQLPVRETIQCTKLNRPTDPRSVP